MQVIWPGGTIPEDHVTSLERLTENQVSTLRSYQNSTPVKGIWEKLETVKEGSVSVIVGAGQLQEKRSFSCWSEGFFLGGERYFREEEVILGRVREDMDFGEKWEKILSAEEGSRLFGLGRTYRGVYSAAGKEDFGGIRAEVVCLLEAAGERVTER